MYKQEPGDRYKMDELSFISSDGQEKVTLMCISYENGVRVCVTDLQNVFEYDFSKYLSKVYEEREKEYLYENVTDPSFEVIPLAVLVDAVYSMPVPDKETLFNWLDAIESRLVRIW